MNWFSSSRWLWRGLRGQSVTFAALFALGLLGFSVLHALRHLLHAVHAPWYLWLILPFALVSAAARWETVLFPDELQRRRWSRGLIFGSIAIGLLLARCSPAADREESGSAVAPHSIVK